MDSFTETEKRFLLGEMIKASSIDLQSIVNFANGHNIQPDWFSMQLPNGRNMNQCIGAAHKMGVARLQTPVAPATKRKSISDEDEQPVSKRPALGTPIEPQPPMYLPRNVNIQPRPMAHNGAAFAPPIIYHNPAPLAMPQRKRGRPSNASRKADKEAAARAAGAYPYSTPPLLAPHPGPHATALPPRDHSQGPVQHYATSASPADSTPKGGSTPGPGVKSEPRSLPDVVVPPNDASSTSQPSTAAELPGIVAQRPSTPQSSTTTDDPDRRRHPALAPLPQMRDPAMDNIIHQQLKESHTPVNTQA